MAWLRTTSDRVIITRAGFTYTFTANKPREVSDIAVEHCLAAGCLRVSDPPSQEIAIEVQSEDDDAELDEALRTVIESGNIDDFKVDKTPKSQVVNSLLTNKRTAREIAERFAEIMNGGNI